MWLLIFYGAQCHVLHVSACGLPGTSFCLVENISPGTGTLSTGIAFIVTQFRNEEFENKGDSQDHSQTNAYQKHLHRDGSARQEYGLAQYVILQNEIINYIIEYYA